MQFNTYIFIFFYIPVVLMGYYLTNKFSNKMGKAFVIIMSCIFYAYAGVAFFLLLLGVMFCNYLFVILLNRCEKREQSRKILITAVIMNILILLYFKYYNFFIINLGGFTGVDFQVKNIFLPLGISFFTFQEISYLVETYRGNTRRFTIQDYMLYIVFFPKLLMGPMIKPQELVPQFNDFKKNRWNRENFMVGIRMFNIGLFKKAVVADTFARAVDWGFGNTDVATSIDFLIVMLAYSFQIYFDFSGYSDMAIGISKMMNVELPINFDSPYKATSMKDFWRRWHMTLTGFLTQYIYIPLGGSRKGKLRTYGNIMVVYLVSGLWHGANWTFILWGGLHGIVQVIERFGEKTFNKLHKIVRWIISFTVVNILWLLFRAESVQQWIFILKRIFLFDNMQITQQLMTCFNLPEIVFVMNHFPFNYLSLFIEGLPMILFLLISIVACLCLNNTFRRKYSMNYFTPIISAGLFCWSLISLSGEAVFIYNNF